jgi:two-component system, chemotaxis family, chemotaxis protein CheY
MVDKQAIESLLNGLPATSSFPGRKVMLVDDSEVIRENIKNILKPTKVTVIEAAHGEEALEVLKQHPDISLMLVDVNMPVMNGLVLAQRIRDDIVHGKLKEIPVVMVTTERTVDKVQMGKQAGVIGWLIKPVNPEHLLKTVEKILK